MNLLDIPKYTTHQRKMGCFQDSVAINFLRKFSRSLLATPQVSQMNIIHLWRYLAKIHWIFSPASVGPRHRRDPFRHTTCRLAGLTYNLIRLIAFDFQKIPIRYGFSLIGRILLVPRARNRTYNLILRTDLLYPIELPRQIDLPI